LTDAPDRLTPAAPEDLVDALAFALRFDGRKRKRDSGEIMAAIAARRLVEHLERAGFVVMRKPSAVGAAALGRGYGRAMKLVALLERAANFGERARQLGAEGRQSADDGDGESPEPRAEQPRAQSARRRRLRQGLGTWAVDGRPEADQTGRGLRRA
jgi:hypothetical protein